MKEIEALLLASFPSTDTLGVPLFKRGDEGYPRHWSHFTSILQDLIYTGSSLSAVNYQAYLLDGITRWNSLCTAAAIDSPSQTIRTLDSGLQERVYTHNVH